MQCGHEIGLHVSTKSVWASFRPHMQMIFHVGVHFLNYMHSSLQRKHYINLSCEDVGWCYRFKDQGQSLPNNSGRETGTNALSLPSVKTTRQGNLNHRASLSSCNLNLISNLGPSLLPALMFRSRMLFLIAVRIPNQFFRR